jgi:C_GCAxxG_C_C family probable redox protein
MTLEERKARAIALHKQGYNCAQCVVMAFSDRTGLSDAVAAKIAMGLGGGVGAQGEICGVVTGMAIAEGTTHEPVASEKPASNKTVRDLTESFVNNNHHLRCRDLKTVGRIPCNDLILNGVEILHKWYEANQ